MKYFEERKGKGKRREDARGEREVELVGAVVVVIADRCLDGIAASMHLDEGERSEEKN
jgi:hypothetical protein